MSTALERQRQAAVYQKTGVLVPIGPPAEEPPMDVQGTLKTTVADVFRQRAKAAEREAASDPPAAAAAQADARLWLACARACEAGRMPLIVGTNIVPALPAGLNEVQRQACAAGLTQIISSNHPEG